MVLQQAPNQANVWGYTSDCEDKVTIKFIQEEYSTTLIKGTLELTAFCFSSLFLTPRTKEISYMDCQRTYEPNNYCNTVLL